MDLLSEPWALEFHSGIPVYRQIMHRIQAEVAAGRLKEGDQLPPIRALCQKLDVNPNTVARAYRDLTQAGVIEAQQGSGSYVAPPKATPALSAKEKKTKVSELTARLTAEAQSHGIRIEDLIANLQQRKAHA
jgi:GntR family transcriptional regulator